MRRSIKWRERALRVVLLFVGLFFSAAIIPLIGGLRDPAGSDTGDTMMMSLYATLGVFLLIAVRRPAEHRGIIAFAGWANIAHAVTMSIQALEIPPHHSDFLIGSALIAVIAVVLLVLMPPQKTPVPAASTPA